MFDYFRSYPSVIDVSSKSGEEFTVEPGNVQELGERFRIGRPSLDAMSAFVGAAAATLFPPHSPLLQPQNAHDLSPIERQIIELIDEHQSHRSISPTSFIDIEFEESPESPDDQEMEDNRSLNSYGRPSAAILPTPRERGRGRGLVPRPIRTYPPGFSTESSNLTVIGDNMQEIREDNFNSGYTSTQIGPPITNPIMPKVNIDNPAPMMIQIPPICPVSQRSKVVIQFSQCHSHSKCFQCRLPVVPMYSCYLQMKGHIQVVTHRDAEHCRMLQLVWSYLLSNRLGVPRRISSGDGVRC